jgi:hypothetical protein
VAGRWEVLASLLTSVMMVVVSVVHGEGGSLGRGCEGELGSGWRDIDCVRGPSTARHRGILVGSRGINRCGGRVPPRASQLRIESWAAIAKGGGFVGASVRTRGMVQPLLLQGLGLGLLRLLPTSVDHLDVVVEDGCNHWHQVGLDDPGADCLRAADTDINHALEGEVPLPHIHHILAPALLQNTHQSLDAAIDGQDVAYPRGGGGEVGEMVQGVD